MKPAAVVPEGRVYNRRRMLHDGPCGNHDPTQAAAAGVPALAIQSITEFSIDIPTVEGAGEAI